MLQPKSERLYFGGHLTLSKKVFYWGFVWGADPEIYRKLVQIKGFKVSASGGITTLEEIDCLKTMGVHAAVLGKAVYEGRLSLAEAVRRAEE